MVHYGRIVPGALYEGAEHDAVICDFPLFETILLFSKERHFIKRDDLLFKFRSLVEIDDFCQVIQRWRLVMNYFARI